MNCPEAPLSNETERSAAHAGAASRDGMGGILATKRHTQRFRCPQKATFVPKTIADRVTDTLASRPVQFAPIRGRGTHRMQCPHCQSAELKPTMIEEYLPAMG